jgi:hypothetical protein
MATLRYLRHRAKELNSTLDILSEKILGYERALVKESSEPHLFQLRVELREAYAKRKELDQELDDVSRQIIEKEAEQFPDGTPPNESAPGDGGRNHAGEPHNFDLADTTEACLSTLLGMGSGLVGLTVCCNSHRFLNNLCERLKYELGRENVDRRELWSISPTHTPLERALKNMRNYRSLLVNTDVLVAVDVPDEEVAGRLWRGLCEEFGGSLGKRLIVIIAIPSARGCPEGMAMVPAPSFKKVHVYQWVRDVVDGMKWPRDLIHDWMEGMLRECDVEGQLDVDSVYEYVVTMLAVLKQCATVADFRSRLEERKRTGLCLDTA